MTEEKVATTEKEAPATVAQAPGAVAPAPRAKNFSRRRGSSGEGGGHGRGRSSKAGNFKRGGARSEFAQKVVGVRRVTRVVAGGRRFTFSVVVVLGDRNGSVGVGTGKALDTALAIEKAIRDAKKNMIKVKRTKTNSIPHEVYEKYSSTRVHIFRIPGRGLVAGSSVRSVLDLAGITDVSAKILSRSKNKINNAQAAIQALKQLQ